MARSGSRLATRGYCGLKFNKDSLCHGYRKTWTPDQLPHIDSWLGIAQDTPPPKMGPILYP